MSNRTLLSQLMELAQSSDTFSAGVLGNTQASISKKSKPKNTKFSGKIAYENEEVAKVDRARSMLKTMLSGGDFDRQEVLNQLMKHLGITEETATSYFQRIAKEMGLTGGKDDDEQSMSSGPAPEDDATAQQKDQTLEPQSGQEDPEVEGNGTPNMEDQDTHTSDDPNRQGAIRVIKNAHLVYKRQNEEGTFTELWVYNIQSNVADELEIRRDILAGTDIPPRRQQSEDGEQEYRITTLGNAQMLEIKGLPQ